MEPKVAALNIRNISPEFLTDLKLAAITEGKTLKDYVIAALIDRIQYTRAQTKKGKK